MTKDSTASGSKHIAQYLTPEEARKKREYHLELARQRSRLSDENSDEVDPADSTMATFILPGD